MKLKVILIFLVFLFFIETSLAIQADNSDFRFDFGYLTFNQSQSQERGYGGYIAGTSDDLLLRLSGPLEYDITSPNISLVSPDNNIYSNNIPQTFIYTVIEDNPKNCSLIINDEINSTSTSIYKSPTQNSIIITLYDAAYNWNINCTDIFNNIGNSSTRTLTIDTIAPTSFNLSSPLNSTSSKDNTPSLSWLATSDANFENYTIEISNESDFSIDNFTFKSTTTSFSNWTTPLSTGQWFWRVTAYDKASNSNLSNQIFNYTVEEISTAGEPTTQVISSITTEVGGSSKKPFTIDIIAPGDITIYSNDTLLIPLIVTNPSNAITLRTILLNVSSNYTDISPSLSISQIPSLRPKEQRKVDLTIITHTEPGTYGITITAQVVNPNFVDTFRIFANLIESDKAEKDPVRAKLDFAKKLFSGNPRCLDLSEFLKQAELAIQQGKYDQALNLAENAISGCEKLLALEQEKEIIQTKFPFIEKLKQNKNTPIIITEVFGALILLIIAIKYIKKKKPSKDINKF